MTLTKRRTDLYNRFIDGIVEIPADSEKTLETDDAALE